MGGKIFNLVSIVIIAFLLMGGITILFKVYHHLYGKELWNRIDPIYQHSKISNKSASYLFLGDSRIVQWEIPDSIIPSNQLYNFGLDTQTSSQVLQRTKDYFTSYQAHYVIIQVGINDLKTIGFFPEHYEYITGLTIDNIKLLLQLCKKHHSIPIYMTIIPPGDVEYKRFLFWNKSVNKSVKEVNTAIVAYCETEKIKVFDASQLLSLDGFKIRKEYQKDCLHLNEKGYKLLNSKLNKMIVTNKFY